ncbi:hypothetical protein [Maritimibacter sp. UBA3975]|uniref:hypothetical protein n=1 Tax=Maritimibacter sp. UBA3975 TaxID=1946833 RepID=UPI000C0A525D|nr:hypothetical protein [Maritimibacter sp. UBA3975]MAM60763.1 hypothetical protein [Maritimibacter sp.]|tara:strand:+ start:24487 stop:25515 length:1029 start_codon:yes stop_codon:yes gene_type:complete
MRVYLHIGHYKTGTTAFQAYCAANAKGLARRGLHYVEAGRLPVAPTNHAGLSVPLAQTHGFVAPSWYRGGPDADVAYARLQNELSSAPARRALISSEEFVQLALCNDPQAALADLASRLAPHRVTTIFTVREPLSLLTSWYAQVCRAPRPRPTFLSFFAGLNPDFLAQAPIASRFAAAFGPSSLRVIGYGGPTRAQVHRLLWATRTIPYSRADIPLANVTPGPAELEVARYAKRRAGGDDGVTVSVVSLADLDARIAAINAGYARLARLLRGAPASALSLRSVVSHYCDLLRPASQRIALDLAEGEALAGLAEAAADSSVSDALRGAAALVRASQIHERLHP